MAHEVKAKFIYSFKNLLSLYYSSSGFACTTHVPGTGKTLLGPLELELLFASLCVSAGNQTRVLWKSSECS